MLLNPTHRIRTHHPFVSNAGGDKNTRSPDITRMWNPFQLDPFLYETSDSSSTLQTWLLACMLCFAYLTRCSAEASEHTWVLTHTALLFLHLHEMLYGDAGIQPQPQSYTNNHTRGESHMGSTWEKEYSRIETWLNLAVSCHVPLHFAQSVATPLLVTHLSLSTYIKQNPTAV